MGRRGPAPRGNHEAAARGGSLSAERRGSFAGAWPPLELYRAIINPAHGFAPRGGEEGPMSNPERTQHGLFFEIVRVSVRGGKRQFLRSICLAERFFFLPSFSSLSHILGILLE